MKDNLTFMKIKKKEQSINQLTAKLIPVDKLFSLVEYSLFFL